MSVVAVADQRLKNQSELVTDQTKKLAELLLNKNFKKIDVADF